MIEMLAMAGLNAGLSLMSGLGNKQATAKQNRLQMIENARVDQLNQERLAAVNAERQRLGHELLTVEEKTTVEDNSWQATSHDVDIAGFIAAGAMAGYNPVTWLQSGALSMFSRSMTQNGGAVTTTRTGHNAADAFKIMMPDWSGGIATTIQKEPSMLSVIGDAGQAGLSMFKDLYKMDQSQQFQSSMLDRQLSAIAQRSSGGGIVPGSGGLYSYGPSISMGGATGGSAMLTGGGGGGGSNSKLASSLPYPASWERGEVEVTNPHRIWKVDKDNPNAEQYSDRYGDVWEEIFGTANVVNDTVLNATGKTLRQWGKETGWNIGDYKTFGAWYESKMKTSPWLQKLDNYAKTLN